MDDPLIGLTIFDSRQKPSSSGPGRPISTTSTSSSGKRSRRSESVDSNKLREEQGSRREHNADSQSKGCSTNERTSGTTRRTNSKSRGVKKASTGGRGKPARSSEISGDLDKCFPCLPGVEDPSEGEEKEREKSAPSSDESTPTTSPMPLNENHVDGGMASLAINTSSSTPEVVDSNILMNSPVPQPQNYWLMRLFQSKLFDMSIAIGYLFNSKDSDVQAYLGNKLFVSGLTCKPCCVVICGYKSTCSCTLPPLALCSLLRC